MKIPEIIIYIAVVILFTYLLLMRVLHNLKLKRKPLYINKAGTYLGKTIGMFFAALLFILLFIIQIISGIETFMPDMILIVVLAFLTAIFLSYFIRYIIVPTGIYDNGILFPYYFFYYEDIDYYLVIKDKSLPKTSKYRTLCVVRHDDREALLNFALSDLDKIKQLLSEHGIEEKELKFTQQNWS